MNKIITRFKMVLNRKKYNQSGESIAETLVALLISALALTMLAGCITATTHLITKSRIKLNTYQNNIESVVTMSGTPTAGRVAFSEIGGSSVSLVIPDQNISYYDTSFADMSIGVYKKSGE